MVSSLSAQGDRGKVSTNRKKNRILELGCEQVKAPGAVGVDSKNFSAGVASKLR